MPVESCEIKRFVEAMLFVADGPVEISNLARALEEDQAAVEIAIGELAQETAARGISIARSGQRVQLVTAPDASAAIERFLGIADAAKLSGAAMETLAIVAYRQPITRAQVESIRGVNADAVMRTLQARQLIEPVGRLQQAGRPVLYGTTFEFLEYFGMASLGELPPLPDASDETLAEGRAALEGAAQANASTAETAP